MSGKKKKKKNDNHHQTSAPTRYELSLARFERRLYTFATNCNPNEEFPGSNLPPGVTRHLCGKASNLMIVEGSAGCGKTTAVVKTVRTLCKNRSKEQDFMFHISLKDLSHVFTLDDKIDVVDLFAFADPIMYREDHEDVVRQLSLLQSRIVLIFDDAHNFLHPISDDLPIMEDLSDKVPVNVLVQNLIRGDILQDILKIVILEHLPTCFKQYASKVHVIEHYFNLDALIDKFAGNYAKTIRELLDNCQSFQYLRSSPVAALDFIEEIMVQFGKGDNYKKAIKKEKNLLLNNRHYEVKQLDGEAFLDFFVIASEYLIKDSYDGNTGIAMNFMIAKNHPF